MSASPARSRKRGGDGYRPRIITTVGQRPACLVNASVTYVGNDKIYAFGGFDQYTDEVYNHVLKLDLNARQWSLVDNYGDIPGVRMGHTANLWQGDKLLVYGGENEHRTYLSDVIIFDLRTAHWTQPDLNGVAPRGRARHSAVIHDEKLFVMGGMTGSHSFVLDDICFLDLKTWTWSRTWRFVPRYDHTSWVWEGRIWIFGGLGEAMERPSEIWWLDFRGTPGLENSFTYGTGDRTVGSSRFSNTSYSQPQQPAQPTTGYAANSSSVQVNPNQHVNRPHPVAPGSISSLKFISSPDMPSQTSGSHFHVFSSGCLLDFVTPGSVINPAETSLSCLDLETLRWSHLADGKDMFDSRYRWLYCAMNDDCTHAWLLGCPTEPTRDGNPEEFLSDVLPIDLRKLGLLGNSLTAESRAGTNKLPASDARLDTPGYLTGIGADLARTFDQPPESGSGTDFTVTALRDIEIDLEDEDATYENVSAQGVESDTRNISQPIHVHKFILQARWPHFSRMYNAQMREFHTKRLHIPEPYSAVRAFLYYLYTDSIGSGPSSAPSPAPDATPNASSSSLVATKSLSAYHSGPTLTDVAGMLVLSNIYDMPRLRLLCVHRLSRDLDIAHAAIIWERAGTAGEDWLRRRAAVFCMTYWGRVVRTPAFRSLRREAMVELCEEGVDVEGRVVGGEELEIVGGLGGGRFGVGGTGRKMGMGSLGESEMDEDEEGGEGEGMEIS